MPLTTAERRHLDRQFQAIRSLTNVTPADRRFEYRLENVGVGDFIRFGDYTYRVEKAAVYEETEGDFSRKTGSASTELTILCLETGESTSLEWEVDDELEVSVTTERLKFRDLRDDEGDAVDEDDLEAACENEEALFYNGTRFVYDDDWEAVYEEGGTLERAYFYEFVAGDGTSITIEEWVTGRNEEYQLYRARTLNPDEIEVIAKGGGDGN